MGAVYATINDISALWRTMNSDEQSKASSLLPVVSACLREEAKKVGKNLDTMIAADDDLAFVAKSVTVDVVARALMTSTNSEPMTQMSQSALGYTVSGSPLVAGGGLFIKKSELARLGIKRAKVGTISLIGGGYDA